MFMKRAQAFISLVTALLLMISCAEAQIKKTNKTNKTKYTKGTKALKDGFKVLAEGMTSEVEKPFVFVARDAETYAALQKLIPDLPKQDGKFFESNAVIAAFLGQRSTGGYGIVIANINSKIEIKETAPPKGSMTIQVITSPYKVVAVPLKEDATFEYQKNLGLDKAWQAATERYGADGEIAESGGFAPTERSYPVYGEIRVMRYGDYATLMLWLQDKSKDSSLKMTDVATGVAQQNGSFKFTRIDPGSLVRAPRPTFNGVGSFKNNSLTLLFDSNETNVSDGYEGKGKIEAVKK
jgi:hypothetical protein